MKRKKKVDGIVADLLCSPVTPVNGVIIKEKVLKQLQEVKNGQSKGIQNRGGNH
jgi:hypothetical protein